MNHRHFSGTPTLVARAPAPFESIPPQTNGSAVAAEVDEMGRLLPSVLNPLDELFKRFV